MTDEAAAKEEIEKTLAVMDGSLRVSPTKFPIRYVMQTISDGVRKVRCVSLYKQLEPFAEVAGLAIGDPVGQSFSSTEQQYTTITTIGHEC